MRDSFASTETLQRLKKKFEDEDLTLSREQVSFLFLYIEALELALNYAAGDDLPEREHRSPVAYFVQEAMAPLPELDDDDLRSN